MKLKEIREITGNNLQFKCYLTILFLLFILLVLVANSAEAAKSTVHLKAGYLNYVKEKIEVSKGVEIVKGEITVTAPRGEILRQKEKAYLYEGVNMNYELGKIDSKEMTAWLKEDKYVFRKEVVFVYNKLQDNKSQEMILKTPFLTVFPDDETFKAQQGVVINYNKKLIKAEKADYNPDQGTLTLSKNIYIEKENGDWVRGNKAVIYLDSKVDKFTVDGKVEIELKVNGGN